jgi:tRNA G37 N-methylase Trm5
MSGIERKISHGMFRFRRHLFYLFWRHTLRLILGKRSEDVLTNPKLFNFFILARVCYVRRIKNSAIVQARYDGLIFVQAIDNVFINDEIFFEKVYELHRKVSKHDVVVDLGAHAGVFSIKAAAVASRVISVEPDAYNFKLLNYNTRVNHLENLILIN